MRYRGSETPGIGECETFLKNSQAANFIIPDEFGGKTIPILGLIRRLLRMAL